MNYAITNDALAELDEQGTVDTYLAIVMHQQVSKNPKAFRAALLDLETVLIQNQDMLSFDNIVEIYHTLVLAGKNYKNFDQILDSKLESGDEGNPSIALKLFRAFEHIDRNDAHNMRKVQRLVEKHCHSLSHQDVSDLLMVFTDLDREHDGFAETRISLRDEIECRDRQALAKSVLT